MRSIEHVFDQTYTYRLAMCFFFLLCSCVALIKPYWMESMKQTLVQTHINTIILLGNVLSLIVMCICCFWGLTVGFLLLQFSVVCTVESLSLFYLYFNINLYILGDD